MYCKSDSVIYPYCCCLVAKSNATLATLWTVAHQALLSVGFPMQEYWSRLPFHSPEDIPNPGIEPTSPALQADSLPLSNREAHVYIYVCVCTHTHTHTHIYIYIHTHIYIFFLRFFFIIGYYSILSIVVSCAVQ